MHDCLIAFGSNEGDSSQIFDQAVDRLNQVEGIVVSARSQAHRTEPVGGPQGQDAYLNAAVRIQTTLSPQELHQSLIQVETSLGRQRRTRWGARKIDLDLLIYDDLQLESEKLTIPHPRMSFRRFVLDPACEIAGEMNHPTSGLSLRELVECLNRDDLILLVDPDSSADFESMVRSALPSNWRLATAVEVESFKDSHETVKLACFVDRRNPQAGHRTIAPGMDQQAGKTKTEQSTECGETTAQFAGPSLRLTEDLDKSRIEILAAIDAMSPKRQN